VVVYVNGQYSANCTNISTNKEINQAGEFVLGQSYRENFNFKPQQRKEHQQQQQKQQQKAESASSSSHGFALDDNGYVNNLNMKFDKQYSFVGRLFNFNVWNYAKSRPSIARLHEDCRLAYCGNATQWADFRQGTRGEVRMRWPTDLLWKSKSTTEFLFVESLEILIIQFVIRCFLLLIDHFSLFFFSSQCRRMLREQLSIREL
jgi:hypothetical protein